MSSELGGDERPGGSHGVFQSGARVAESTGSGDPDGGGHDVFQSGTHGSESSMSRSIYGAESMRGGDQDGGGQYVFHSMTSEGREVLGQSVDLCVPSCSALPREGGPPGALQEVESFRGIDHMHGSGSGAKQEGNQRRDQSPNVRRSAMGRGQPNVFDFEVDDLFGNGSDTE